MAKFFLDDLASNPNATVILTHLPNTDALKTEKGRPRTTGPTWTSYITDDLVLSMSSDYSSPWADYAAGATEKWNQISSLIAQGPEVLRNSDLVKNFLGVSIKTYAQSVMLWTNSERPSFQIPMHFVTWRDNQNVTQVATELASMTLPGISSEDNESVMTKPGGYTIEADSNLSTFSRADKVKGTWALNIGGWFTARNLVLESTNLTMSKERTTVGEPLFATVECQLTPYRMVSYDEFLGWFKQGGRRTVNSSNSVRSGRPR